MNGDTTDHEAEEDTLTYEVSDEALEAAAGTGTGEKRATAIHYTWNPNNFCC